MGVNKTKIAEILFSKTRNQVLGGVKEAWRSTYRMVVLQRFIRRFSAAKISSANSSNKVRSPVKFSLKPFFKVKNRNTFEIRKTPFRKKK